MSIQSTSAEQVGKLQKQENMCSVNPVPSFSNFFLD